MTALCFFHPSRVYKQEAFHVWQMGRALCSPTGLRKTTDTSMPHRSGAAVSKKKILGKGRRCSSTGARLPKVVLLAAALHLSRWHLTCTSSSSNCCTVASHALNVHGQEPRTSHCPHQGSKSPKGHMHLTFRVFSFEVANEFDFLINLVKGLKLQLAVYDLHGVF